eukprot:TRINITY_DN2565_c0_g1_i1.p1 TRINITY_DN2565_c0_g1~~TRINITY_DN2565_c0_g1_i1.p1  ORF type:complete len:115 (+),score=3.66 TRINITY_DN2565_c0_g1_i1:177-521(+)
MLLTRHPCGPNLSNQVETNAMIFFGGETHKERGTMIVVRANTYALQHKITITPDSQSHAKLAIPTTRSSFKYHLNHNGLHGGEAHASSEKPRQPRYHNNLKHSDNRWKDVLRMR